MCMNAMIEDLVRILLLVSNVDPLFDRFAILHPSSSL